MNFSAGFSRPEDGDTPFGVLFNYERNEKYFQLYHGGRTMSLTVDYDLEMIGGCVQENVPVSAEQLARLLLWCVSIDKGVGL